MDRLQDLVTEHGYFHTATRTEHLGDFVRVLDAARMRYRAVRERAIDDIGTKSDPP